MNKLGRCHNLGPELIPWGKFSRQPVVLGLVIHVILFTSRTWQNSLVEALSLWKNLCSWKNQKQKKVLGKKRLVLVPRGAPRLRPDFERRGRLQTKFAIHNVENEVPFIYVNTRLDKNRNFESFRSVRCLAPQHIFRFFFISTADFVVLLNAPLSDRDKKRYAPVSLLNWYSQLRDCRF